jgi:hypothetical protein
MPERQIPETCTCGATLVERSRFCHMCGRPVSGTEFSDTETTPVPALEQASLQDDAPQQAGLHRPGLQGVLPQMSAAARSGPLPVGFSNPVALRVAILMSLATMFMEMIPGVNLLFLVWGMAAGWCAVLLYRRLTGYVLSVKAGARLGSLTGILTFLSLLVISTVTMAIMGKDVFQQIKQDPQVAQALNDPPTLVATFIVALLILFAIVVGTCAAGGALGARFVGRNSANNRV